jgi:hypothetical protein
MGDEEIPGNLQGLIRGMKRRKLPISSSIRSRAFKPRGVLNQGGFQAKVSLSASGVGRQDIDQG